MSVARAKRAVLAALGAARRAADRMAWRGFTVAGIPSLGVGEAENLALAKRKRKRARISPARVGE